MRARSLALVVSIAALSLLPVSPAYASDPTVPNCPTGYYAEAGGRCVGFDGSTGSGGVIQSTAPTAPLYPSSVLGAVSGGNTGDGGTNIAIVNASNKAVSFSKATSIAQAGSVAVTGLSVGFSIGQAGSKVACSFGASALCIPSKTLGYTPNGDLGGDTAGWPSGLFPFQTGFTSAPTYSAVTPDPTKLKYRVAPPSARGDTTVAGSAQNTITTAFISGGGGPQITGYFYCWNGTGLVSNSFMLDTPNGTLPSGGYTWSNSSQYRTGSPAGGCDSGQTFDHITVTQFKNTTGNWSWYPVGHPSRPAPAQTTSPVRYWWTTSTCGSSGDFSSVASATFHEEDATFPQYPDAPACAVGGAVTAIKVVEKSVGGTPPDKTMFTWTAPDAYKTFETTYPQCTPEQGSPCQLGLWNVAGASPVNCYTNSGVCNSWFTDANKSTNYKCTYGVGAASTYSASQVVALSECNVLAPTFDPVQQAKGNPYGNPTTGAPPADQTGGQPGGAGSGTNGDGSDGPSCFPSGWSAFNPLEWIVKPLLCVLKDLFIPKPGAMDDVTGQLSNSFKSSSLGTWGNSLSGIGNLGSIASDSCAGISMHIPDLGVLHTANDFSAFSTCAQPWSGIAAVVRAFITLAIAWGVALGCYRIIASSFGLALPERG